MLLLVRPLGPPAHATLVPALADAWHPFGPHWPSRASCRFKKVWQSIYIEAGTEQKKQMDMEGHVDDVCEIGEGKNNKSHKRLKLVKQ